LVKRICFLIIAIMMLFIPFSTAMVYADTNNVIDHLGSLTDNEMEYLQSEIDNIRDQLQLDAVIVITDDTGGKSSMAYADDYYDYNGYGVGSDYSGLLLLVNMDIREVWISTTGRAIGIYNDAKIENMTYNVSLYIGDGEYFNACKAFLSDVRIYYNSGNEVSTGESPKSYWEKVKSNMGSFALFGIALVLSVVVTLIFLGSHKGQNTVSNKTYEEAGTFLLTGQRDDFIRENTSKVRIESSSKSSGRSSSHRSSSGRSHGGGGRRI